MKIARREFDHDGRHYICYVVYCPACEHAHRFDVEGRVEVQKDGSVKDANWTFDGNLELPTFSPSLKSTSTYWENEKWVDKVCHSYLRNGLWEFQKDCTHAMKGQKVPMVDFPENYRV